MTIEYAPTPRRMYPGLSIYRSCFRGGIARHQRCREVILNEDVEEKEEQWLDGKYAKGRFFSDASKTSVVLNILVSVGRGSQSRGQSAVSCEWRLRGGGVTVLRESAPRSISDEVACKLSRVPPSLSPTASCPARRVSVFDVWFGFCLDGKSEAACLLVRMGHRPFYRSFY